MPIASIQPDNMVGEIRRHAQQSLAGLTALQPTNDADRIGSANRSVRSHDPYRFLRNLIYAG